MVYNPPCSHVWLEVYSSPAAFAASPHTGDAGSVLLPYVSMTSLGGVNMMSLRPNGSVYVSNPGTVLLSIRTLFDTTQPSPCPSSSVQTAGFLRASTQLGLPMDWYTGIFTGGSASPIAAAAIDVIGYQ